MIRFLDWFGTIAKFEITERRLPDGSLMNFIIVAYEGDWTDELLFNDKFKFYEDVQLKEGSGLKFIDKAFIPILRRTFFKFKLDNSPAILAVPATGEEFNFEIYGSDGRKGLHLLHEQEL